MKTLKFKHIIGFILFNVIFISCSDSFLDLSPISNANESSYYKTEKDFETAVTAAYATLYTEFGPQSGVSFCGEQMSDEATVYDVMGNATDHQAFKNYTLNAANTFIKQIWEDEYNNLHIVNTVIAKLEESSIASGPRAGYEAEMRFLRALYHFNLVRMFGDVPLMNKPVVVSESYKTLRTPVAEVYNFIISDLKFAADNLPLQSQTSRAGQATKGAAQGILGKVYLTVGKKDSARIELNEIIKSNQYELLPDFGYLWDLKHKNSKEALLEIQYIGQANAPSSPYHEYFCPYNNMTISGQGRGMNQVTEYLWSDFEQNDPRQDLSIFTGYSNNSRTWIDVKFPKKWFDPVWINSKSYYCDNNFIVLRYADVLLMYAEATDDPTYLNMVRDRAGVPRYGEFGYPNEYSTLALAIEHEREVELALEFHRFFDLKRTGRATTVLTARKGKAITEQMLVLPIPQSERDKNPDLTQNPGY
ncbi:membrane protein [Bacteroidia bacterium]|nr:membrane protein [Bacteroidia bacterium]